MVKKNGQAPKHREVPVRSRDKRGGWRWSVPRRHSVVKHVCTE